MANDDPLGPAGAGHRSVPRGEDHALPAFEVHDGGAGLCTRALLEELGGRPEVTVKAELCRFDLFVNAGFAMV